MTKFQSKISGLFYGTAVYDALGLPAENQIEEYIKANLSESDQKFFSANGHNPYMTDHLPAVWSDDTQLTIAVAQGVVNSQAIDMLEQANQLVLAGDKYKFMGWGTATRNAAKFLKSNNKDKYLQSGTKGSLGNGVLMKMAPLALAIGKGLDMRGLTALQLIEQFTRMTHDTTMAVVCSAVHAEVLGKLFEENPDKLTSKESRLSLLQEAKRMATRFEIEYGVSEDERALSKQVGLLVENFEELDQNRVLLNISNGGKCLAPDTLTMVYGLLGADFSIDAARRAIRIGGDTDSNASIIGGIIGYIFGVDAIPKHLREEVADRELLDRISVDFSRAISHQH